MNDLWRWGCGQFVHYVNKSSVASVGIMAYICEHNPHPRSSMVFNEIKKILHKSFKLERCSNVFHYKLLLTFNNGEQLSLTFSSHINVFLPLLLTLNIVCLRLWQSMSM